MNGAVTNLSSSPEAIRLLGRELRHGGYDVVHVHEPNVPVISWFAAEAARSATVGTFHTYSTGWLANSIAANVIGARRMYSKLNARIAVSEAAEWTARRYYGGRYRIVPNGVDLSAARPSATRPHERLEILFIGRAEGRKGLPVLLRAFEALRGAGVDARLTVAGATEEEVAPLLLETEGVEIAGRVTEEEKWRLLGGADLLCAPSLGGESFGMVLTEAFASSTPVVASRIAGYRDVVRSRQDGLLVPPGDAVELGEALRDLALDPERRLCMARSARERAERFSWTQVAGEVTEVYEEALAQPQPATRRARIATNVGLRAAEPGPRLRPRRIPSLEQKESPTGGRRAARLARRGAVVGGAVAGVGLTALALEPPRARADRALAAGGHADLGAGRIRLDVQLDAGARRGLARDPARRAPGSARAPARHRARHDDRRPDVGHDAGPARRAVARADRGAAARPHARPLPGRARHDRLPDAAEHPRAGGARGGHVRHRRHLPRARRRARDRHGRAGRPARPRDRDALAAPARQADALPAPAAGGDGGARRDAPGAPGLEVFRHPRLGAWATVMQLTAWAIQWLACYVLLVALGLDGHAGIGAAAAVLFAVNVTAALPATPSNLGVFQAACVAVLSAYGVSKTDAFAYGIILQAVEIATALAMGMPALVREGMTWKDLRLRALHASPVQLPSAARRGETAELEA